MTFNFVSFTEKIKDDDPDIRQMALYDLYTELQKEAFILDDHSQKQVVPAVLDRIDDTSTEVQGIAVKCLAPLVKKVKEAQVEKLVTTLSTKCLHETKKEKRDVASTAMKTTVAEIPGVYFNAVRKLTSPLVHGLPKLQDDQAKLDVLDVLNDVVKRFGAVVSDDHGLLQDILLSELNSKSAARRKKSIVCLASLCMFSTDTLFNTVVKTLLDGITSNSGEELRKYIQCCSAVSRTAGQRLGRCLEQVVPLLVKHINATATVDSDEEDEVRENILQAFESFIIRCPGQVEQFFDDIIAVCKTLLTWDPNYSHGAGDTMEEDYEEDPDMVMDDEEMDQEEEDGVSWKVRKASAKCLSAIIATRPDKLETIYLAICSAKDDTLPACFKEREESVKLDIFKTFEHLLVASRAIPVSAKDASETQSLLMSGTFRVRVKRKPEAAHLVDVRVTVVKNLIKCTKEKSIKVKTQCFILLQELAALLGPDLREHASDLVVTVRDALKDKLATSMLKTEVLIFLRNLLVATEAPSTFTQHLGQLMPLVFECVTDKYYKIVSEALRVCGQLVSVVGQLDDANEGKAKTKELFDCVFRRLEPQDIDQDVKESAIATMGRILRESRNLLSPEDSSRAQALLFSLLRNEMSQVITIKTFSNICRVQMDVKILNDAMGEMAGFLRKNNRALRQASLHTLKELVAKKSKDIQPAHFSRTVEELAPLLSEQDLHLSSLALELCANILSQHPPAVKQVETLVLSRVFSLLRSQLLQGHALQAVLGLFETLAEHSTLGYQKLLGQVKQVAADAAPSKQVVSSVAQVVAVLFVGATKEHRDDTVRQFLASLGSPNEQEVVLALTCLGEIGRELDLSPYQAVIPGIRAHLTSPSEELKGVASSALGRVSAGKLDLYVPEILADIARKPQERYLMLRCLKELIAVSSVAIQTPLWNYVDQLLPPLLECSEAPEEGVRNVVAECLGKLALLDPTQVLSALKKKMEAGATPDGRATIITTLKYTILDARQEIDQHLHTDLHGFLAPSLKKQEPVKIRRAAILLLMAAAHNKPEFVRPQLQGYMAALYAETPIDKSLIREVNLGPFKHKVDDGLELRKAAYECMDLILDPTAGTGLLEYLNDYPTFIAHVLFGLKDENQDICMLAHLMVAKLTRVPNAAVPLMTAMDSVAEQLGKTVSKKPKTNAVQQEKDRHEDLLKSCLRAIEAIAANVSGAVDHSKFGDLYNKTVKGDKDLADMLERIKKDNEKAE